MNILFEIVPGTWKAFETQNAFVQGPGRAINTSNVPDIQRFNIRNWELATHVNRRKHPFIPHFRAMDFKIESGESYRIIEQYELENVLLVTGDPPEGLKRNYGNTNGMNLIRAVPQYFPK